MEKKKKYSKKFRNRFRWIFWGSYAIIAIGIVAYFYLISMGKLGFMPSFEELENPKSQLATKIISSDQELLGTYFHENRTRVPSAEISPEMIHALLATEDVRFHSHSGIDFRSLGRVAFGVITRDFRGGGSTISQQLAKLLFPREDHENIFQLINRKFREWVIAAKLEKSYTKNEIIAMYLNKFDFLNLAVGIESASRVYFSTTPDSLKIHEAAMLVGMVKNPSIYNPLRYPEKTIARRNVVLRQMKKYDYISKSVCDSVSEVKLGIDFQKVDHNRGTATYFREFLRQWLTAKKPHPDNYMDHRRYVEDSISWIKDPSYGWCNRNTKANGQPYNIYKDGLKIYTTINSKMQTYAEEAVNEHLGGYLQDQFMKEQKGRKKAPFSYQLTFRQIEQIMKNSMRRSERYRVLRERGLDKDSIHTIFNTPTEMQVFSWNGDIDTLMTPMDSIRYYKHFLNAGFMSMEPQTGYVRAYVGGINYKHFKFDNVSLSRRQVGSTFKPFIYTLAMQNHYSPCYKVPNIPVSFKMPEGQDPPYYTPKYSESKREGEMVTLKYGLANSLNQISAWVLKQFTPQAAINLVQEMGIHSHIDPYPSICVGSAEVMLREMVAAYCTYPNQGIYTRPMFITRIEDKNGNIIAEFSQYRKEAISEETAFLVFDLMKAVVDHGTSVRLRYKYNFTNEIAAKTGTTNNHSDGWFIGITPDLVNGVWVGGEERSIHFRGIRLGQGASMALPIWALYMKKLYSDPELTYSTEATFEKPEKLSVEIDCSKYEQGNGQSINF